MKRSCDIDIDHPIVLAGLQEGRHQVRLEGWDECRAFSIHPRSMAGGRSPPVGRVCDDNHRSNAKTSAKICSVSGFPVHRALDMIIAVGSVYLLLIQGQARFPAVEQYIKFCLFWGNLPNLRNQIEFSSWLLLDEEEENIKLTKPRHTDHNSKNLGFQVPQILI